MKSARILLSLVVALSLFASACGATSSAPSSPGQYPVQKDSVHFDGDRYQLYWADPGGSLHHLDTHNLRLVQDPNGTFLEVPQAGGDPILHLRQDEPITVEGQDRQGAFSSPWFPFLLGATLGNAFGGGRGGQTIVINNPAPGESRSYDASTPAYRYPPTGSFGRDDELHGSLDSSKPQTPDYSRVQPAPYASTGKTSGTGGGSAASNKGGSSISSGASNATSAQSGGSGSGTAASGKGGFSSGSQSYTSSGSGSSVGAGSKGVLPSGGGASSKPSTGSKGIGGARAPSVGRH
jgi:hypothetical protein